MKQLINVVQINQPFCENTFGGPPCTATGDPGTECFNTLKTCQDVPNFIEGVKEIHFQTQCENPLTNVPGLFPTIESLNRTSATINIGSVDPDRNPLGTRDVVNVDLIDHPYHDRWVDPYWETRFYVPLEQGTFWSKWLARNSLYEGVECIVYFGEAGQNLDDMFFLNYEIDTIDGPDSSGIVSIKMSDILKRADDNQVKIPGASNGKLLNDLDNVSTTFDLLEIGSGANYPASGTLSIDKEPMTFTRTGDTFTVTRTVPVSHSANATVQIARVIDNVRFDTLLYDWFINDIGIDPTWIDFAEWEAEVDAWNPTAIIDQVLYKPEGVGTLIGELIRDVSAYIFLDLEEKKIRLRIIRGNEQTLEVNDEEHILKGSFKIIRRNDLKITQLWYYYNPINLFENFKETGNYGNVTVTVSDDFGDAKRQKIKEIMSRFFTTNNVNEVRETSERIVIRFSNEPREIYFSVDREYGKQFKYGDILLLSHREIVDQFGAVAPIQVQIISMSEQDNGRSIDFRTQAFSIEGFKIYKIPPDDMEVWTSASETDKAKYLFLTDDDGLMSDGSVGPTLG